MKTRQALYARLSTVVAAAGLLLTSCAPAAVSGPSVAVLNGPMQGRIGGSAELLQHDMTRHGPLHFRFVNSAAMRFAEGHNDFYHDRAVPTAARVARSYGAPYAVLVGASTLDRKTTLSADKQVRTVDVTLCIEAIVVRAADAQVVARVSSQTLQGTRRESASTPLPPLQKDPTVQALRDQGVSAVAPAVVGALWNALDIHPTKPGG